MGTRHSAHREMNLYNVAVSLLDKKCPNGDKTAKGSFIRMNHELHTFIIFTGSIKTALAVNCRITVACNDVWFTLRGLTYAWADIRFFQRHLLHNILLVGSTDNCCRHSLCNCRKRRAVSYRWTCLSVLAYRIAGGPRCSYSIFCVSFQKPGCKFLQRNGVLQIGL